MCFLLGAIIGGFNKHRYTQFAEVTEPTVQIEEDEPQNTVVPEIKETEENVAESEQISTHKERTMPQLSSRNGEHEQLELISDSYDMSHYTNEVGKHVPKSEGGKNDRKGNPLKPYVSIAVPKSLYAQLPYGSRVKIVCENAQSFYGVVVDTGGALESKHRIDRCVSTAKEAEKLGVVKNVKIYKVI